MERTHYTAWLANDPSCLEQSCMDVTVLEDRLIGGDPDDPDDWTADTSRPTAFYAVTTVDARDGQGADGIAEAEALMRAAGWRVVSDWETTPHALTATVERH
ncbi:hypothetical protein [Streptomyces antimicrobicus]|uniref:Uncharacterized protein n=1 Tax=Streptomyces antimicrobicus TaxID=2883108 RepID=A0ABS8BA73_9ACTN|nr:hypothetical protein [Streptomyces antimicrobicus]MCB5181510.1 hypothetical protein [Streptomyces antimicrobicus]